MEEDIEILGLDSFKENTETLEFFSSKPLPTRSENRINKNESKSVNNNEGLKNAEEVNPKKKDKEKKTTNKKMVKRKNSLLGF